jgi:hypothetical protein
MASGAGKNNGGTHPPYVKIDQTANNRKNADAANDQYKGAEISALGVAHLFVAKSNHHPSRFIARQFRRNSPPAGKK